MRKLIICLTAITLQCTAISAQLETKIDLSAQPVREADLPKKVVKAFSYRLGNLDLCTIAPSDKGHVYRVQFTVLEGFYNDFKQFVAERAYGEVYPEYVLNKNLTRYLLGDFEQIDDAKVVLERIINLGHAHAFIVTYSEGMRVE
jgi:hypothetical protein